MFEKNPLSEATTSLYLFQDQLDYEQEISYKGNREIYYRKPPYLISAAGKFHFYENCAEARVPFISKCGNDDEHGWPTATILTPTLSNSEDYRDMVHFAGHNNIRKRKNFCVDADFACGLNLKTPESYNSCPKIKEGHWTFYDLNSKDCSLGFKLAVYDHECKGSCKKAANNYGLFTVNSDSSIDLLEFKEKIIGQNPREFIYGKEQYFVNFNGKSIPFMISEEGSKIVKNEAKPWLSGSVLNYQGKEIEIDSPILDDLKRIEIQDFKVCDKDWSQTGLNCYYQELKLIPSYSSEETMNKYAEKLCSEKGLKLYHRQHYLVKNPAKKELKVYCY